MRPGVYDKQLYAERRNGKGKETKLWLGIRKGARTRGVAYATFYDVFYKGDGNQREKRGSFLEPPSPARERGAFFIWGPPNLYFLLEESTGICIAGNHKNRGTEGFFQRACERELAPVRPGRPASN